ncbi:hypothetical protein AUC65_02244 [Weissella cibaria]|nr:hypothetical protein AUC65_02244 [Weissella cibaria]
MDAYTVFDGLKQHGVSEMRKSAKKTDIQKVLSYVDKHYTDADAAGIAKGKNVFVIHGILPTIFNEHENQWARSDAKPEPNL